MGSVHHANARTTPRVRQEIQDAKESIAKLAKRHGIDEKTVLKWRHRDFVEDLPSGEKTRRSALTEVEQQALCTVRRHTQLPLDNLLALMKPRIPKLTRSNLHRCLQHHGLSVLPVEAAVVREKKAFKAYPIGYIHIDSTKLHSAEGKHYLFVAIDRTTKYVYAELYAQMTTANAVVFLEHLVEHYPVKITHILTDNGAQLTYKLLAPHLQPKKGKLHPFDALCLTLGIAHRLTQFRHPWTNGQVEITNKLIKQATTKQFYYETMDELKQHLMVFLLYYNHQRPLKSLKLKTPWQFIENAYNESPDLFNKNPHQLIARLNI